MLYNDVHPPPLPRPRVCATQARLHLQHLETRLSAALEDGGNLHRRGLLRGVTLAAPVAARVSDAALDAGFIINAPRPDVLRIAPPLIITATQLDTFITVLPDLLDDAAQEVPAAAG